MGKHDSSKTRVEPVFNHLIRMDPTGSSWVRALMELGSRSEGKVPAKVGGIAPDHGRRWGKEECRLDAPRELLEWLVRNITVEQVEASGDRKDVRDKRMQLAKRDKRRTDEALRLIKDEGQVRKWFILEGRSAPDALIETDELILVVEGKRTERTTTTKTKWMPRRSQLIRHMDAARGIAEGRPVFGLLIVEGDGPNPREVPQRWADADIAQTESPLFESSLPHRSAAIQGRIRDSVLGVVTWQKVCDEFGIPWPPPMTSDTTPADKTQA